MPRLYFALWPDQAARRALAAAAMAVDVRDSHRQRPENLHLTLAFIGEVTTAEATALAHASIAAELAPFKLEVGTTGWWREQRLAWLGPLETPARLLALRQAALGLIADCGVVVDQAEFRPHITIARQVQRAPRTTGAISCCWKVQEFVLVQSQREAFGPRYEIVHKWPLSGPSSD